MGTAYGEVVIIILFSCCFLQYSQVRFFHDSKCISFLKTILFSTIYIVCSYYSDFERVQTSSLTTHCALMRAVSSSLDGEFNPGGSCWTSCISLSMAVENNFAMYSFVNWTCVCTNWSSIIWSMLQHVLQQKYTLMPKLEEIPKAFLSTSMRTNSSECSLLELEVELRKKWLV